MLSIIICSTRPTTDEELVRNIAATIGVAYEIVHIDNSQNTYNIFQAYNYGVEQAKGDLLCFMHEDVLFHTQGWGKIVEQYLALDYIGAIGVAGGSVVLDQLDWRFYGFGTMYLMQGTTTVEESPNYYIIHPAHRPYHHALSMVAVLDGVWMCMRKELFQKIRFDDEHFHDFHLYDSDICMQINKAGKNVFVTYDILLEHKSMGTFSESYKDSLNIFFQKWKSDLPMMKGMVVSKQEMDDALAKAQIVFDKRLAEDALRIGIRQVYNNKRKGQPCRRFTPAERQLIDESAWMCRRSYIRNLQMPVSEVWQSVKDYLVSPYASRRCSLFLKFLWHRIVWR